MVVIAFPRSKVLPLRGLGATHLRVLRYVESHIAREGGWPSFVQISEGCDLGSKKGAVRIVNQLFRANAIQRPDSVEGHA